MTNQSAALAAGYTPLVAKHAIREIVQAPAVKRALEAIFEAKGYSDEQLADDLIAGTKATKLVTSPTEQDKEWPDWMSRHNYLETILRIKHPQNGSNNINVNYVQVIQAHIDKYAL